LSPNDDPPNAASDGRDAPWLTDFSNGWRLPAGCELEFPSRPHRRAIHASNTQGIENPFRVFEAKYSNLIDINELEATMNDHRITTIVRGMHRPSSVPPFVALLLANRISVFSKAQRLVKTVTAA
jgi:hypothetical protein